MTEARKNITGPDMESIESDQCGHNHETVSNENINNTDNIGDISDTNMLADTGYYQEDERKNTYDLTQGIETNTIDGMQKENTVNKQNKTEEKSYTLSPEITQANKLSTNMCSFNVKRERVMKGGPLINSFTHRILSSIVSGYRRTRFYVNITSILVSLIAIFSVLAHLLSFRTGIIPEGCQIESIDLKIDNEIDLTVKTSLNMKYGRPFKLSDVMISISPQMGYDCSCRMVSKYIDVVKDELIEMNFTGPIIFNRPLKDTFEKLKNSGVKIHISGKIHINKFMGLTSSIPFDKTITYNSPTESTNTGLLLELFRGELVDFSKNYPNEEQASLVDITTNKNIQDYSNATTIPFIFHNLKIFSLYIKDFELLYFGDDLKTKTLSFKEFKIEKGVIQPSTIISSLSEEPISSIEKTLMKIYSENKHITLQNICISGYPVLSKYVTIKRSGKSTNKPVDYEVNIKEISVNSVIVTVDVIQNDIQISKTFADLKFSNQRYSIKTLDERAEFITYIDYLLDRNMSTANQRINIHLTKINWHVLFKVLKNLEIVKLFDFEEKFLGFFSFKMMDFNIHIDKIHDMCKETQKGGNFFALKSLIKNEQINFFELENKLNLRIPPNSVNYKRRFKFNIPKTEIRLFNELFDVVIKCEEQSVSKPSHTDRFENEMEFLFHIRPNIVSLQRCLPWKYNLSDIFLFKLDDNTEIDFLKISSGFIKGMKIIGLSNNLRINMQKNFNFEISIEADEKLVGNEYKIDEWCGFNWNIVLARNYKISNIKDTIEIQGLKSLDMTFKENQICFNNLLFNLKMKDNLKFGMFSLKDLIFNISDANTSVIKFFAIFLNCAVADNLIKTTHEFVYHEPYNWKYPEIKRMKLLDILITESKEAMIKITDKINQGVENPSEIECQLDFCENSKNICLNFKYKTNTGNGTVFDVLKRIVLKLNSHKFFKESRSFLNVLKCKDIRNLNDMFQQYSMFPFNNIILNITSIEINIHNGTETVNVIKIFSSDYVFKRNQEKLELQLNIGIRELLDFLGSDEYSYSIVVEDSNKSKFNIYEATEKRSVLSFIKSIFDSKIHFDGKSSNDNRKGTFSIYYKQLDGKKLYINLGALGFPIASLCQSIRSLFCTYDGLAYKIGCKIQGSLLNITLHPNNHDSTDLFNLEIVNSNMDSFFGGLLREIIMLFGSHVELAEDTTIKGRMIDLALSHNWLIAITQFVSYVYIYTTSGDITAIVLRYLNMNDAIYKDIFDIQLDTSLINLRVSIVIEPTKSEKDIELSLWEFHYNKTMMKILINYDKETFFIKKFILLIGKDTNNTLKNTEINKYTKYLRYLLEVTNLLFMTLLNINSN